MGRKARAFYDKRAGCWASSAIGEIRSDKAGTTYRPKVFNRDLTHPVRDELAAQAWLHTELTAIEASRRSAGDITFEALCELYLEDSQHRLGPEAYDRANERMERFGHWPSPDSPNRMDYRIARGITKADIEAFRDSLLSQNLSRSYISQGILSTLRTVFRWATMVRPGKFEGLPLAHNPMTGLSFPSVPRRAARIVDPLKVSRFLRWAWRRAVLMGKGLDGRFARSAVVLLMTLRDTGARPKELCVAEWSEWSVLPDGWGVLRMPAWKWKNGPKTGEERVIAVPPHCTRRIESIRKSAGRHETRIFTHRRSPGNASAGLGSASAGDPWVTLDHERKRKGDTENLQAWFRRMRLEGEAAGYPLSPGFRLYFIRSAYTTVARRRGVDDHALARAQGTSVKMLDRHYTDYDDSDILSVARAVAAR